MAFREAHVDADGFRIRYLESGEGPPLVMLHGAGGLRVTPAHELLSARRRVIAFEMPGFGRSPANTRTRSMAELARTMAEAAGGLGLDGFDLLGTSFGGITALWLAVQAPARVRALVLAAPAAIRPEPFNPPPPPDEQTRALVSRLRGPARDPDLEARMRTLAVPTLVVFGTEDTIVPPTLGRHYQELIPGAHLVLVYAAGHMLGSDRPEAFAEVVDDFLERHEAFVVSQARTVIHP